MITRNNYEEFFLLYVDNELSTADRQLVEKWVAENPDLAEEWDILLQCRISPDDQLIFTNRESLFRREGALAEDNYLEYFLSYVDGELDDITRKSIEDFVRRHPPLLPELERLQRTVNVPDPAIVFENKEILYKKEEDKKVWTFPRKLVAAAVVAGAIALAIFNPLRRAPQERALGLAAGNKALQQTPGSGVAVKKDPAVPRHPGDSGSGGLDLKERSGSMGHSGGTDKSGSGGLADAANEKIHNAGTARKERTPNNQSSVTNGKPADNGNLGMNNQLADNRNSAGKNKSNGHDRPSMKKNTPTVTPGPATALHLSETGQTDQTEERNRTAGVSKKKIQQNSHTEGKDKEDDPDSRTLAQADPLINKRVIDQMPVRVTNGIKGPGNKTIVLTGLTDNDNSSFATRALLNSSDDDPEDGDIMQSSSPGKNKLRGLFRKVSRVLEKNTSREDDDRHHVLIGGFQFALT
jgi:hypothetical protein